MVSEYRGYVGEVVYDDEVKGLHAMVINSGSYPIANAEATDHMREGPGHPKGHKPYPLYRDLADLDEIDHVGTKGHS